MVAVSVALTTIAICALAECLHARRVRRMSRLAFGPRDHQRSWVRIVGPLRVVAAGVTAWGLVVLFEPDKSALSPTMSANARRSAHHLVIALDVSPSMDLNDAGPRGDQSRADRARDVLRSILDRVDTQKTPVSIVAFYTEARPVVIDTLDPHVVANILNDLPLEHAFTTGKTNMYRTVATVAEIGKQWQPNSATLVLASDGDSLPPEDAPKLPAAFDDVLILGVGDRYRGQLIDGHNSRQDALSLERLALRLGGDFNDVNTRHVATTQLLTLGARIPKIPRRSASRKDVAIGLIVFGAAYMALIGPLLVFSGGAWNAAKARPFETFSLGLAANNRNKPNRTRRTGRATSV